MSNLARFGTSVLRRRVVLESNNLDLEKLEKAITEARLLQHVEVRVTTGYDGDELYICGWEEPSIGEIEDFKRNEERNARQSEKHERKEFERLKQKFEPRKP